MKSVIKNLSKESKAYYQDNDYYEIFSRAEDATKEVEQYLVKAVEGKIVFDAGCGTGKYLHVVEENAKKYIGMDLSREQLKKASQKINKKETHLIQGNLKSIPLEDKSVDIIISTWVLGTITNIEERELCLQELKRILKPAGKIILIENDEGSEFEFIRDRINNSKTKDYNDWVLAHNFTKTKIIDDYFLFESLPQAKKCFEVIYSKEKARKVTNKKIKHTIICFEYKRQNPSFVSI